MPEMCQGFTPTAVLGSDPNQDTLLKGETAKKGAIEFLSLCFVAFTQQTLRKMFAINHLKGPMIHFADKAEKHMSYTMENCTLLCIIDLF